MKVIYRLTLLSSCFLVACAPPKPSEVPPTNKVIPLEKRKAETATISSWEINGAMAAKNESKAWSATLNWLQQGPSNYQIRLIGPLGGGTVVINKHGSQITYQDGPKKVTSTNADELLHKETGIRLPVNNLYYWVRGLPAPGGVQSTAHDQYNHLTQLKQNGYTINFTQYTSVKGIDLPSMIRMHGNGMMVKVIIKRWGV